MKIRGFEKISKYAKVDFPMPERKTKGSAGYDICGLLWPCIYREILLRCGKEMIEIFDRLNHTFP